MYPLTTQITTKIISTTLLVFFCNILIITAQNQKPEKYYRVVSKMNKTTFSELKKQGLEVDHVHWDKEGVTAEISRKDLLLLRKNNIPIKINIRNLGKRLPRINKRIDRKNKRIAKKTTLLNTNVSTPTNFELGSMGGFLTLEEALSNLDKMQELYPNLITVKSTIGSSIEDRPIYMVKISDNPSVEEPDEEELLYTAIHHAREPIGLSQTIFYMWYLLENYEQNDEIKLLIDHTALYFVPIINPDGYVYNQTTNPDGGGFWRKNRRNNQDGSFGVDLNRNYGYLWGTNGTSNTQRQDYQGTSAFSEPETEAIKNFVNEHQFITALNYHSFSNLLITPWGHSANAVTPENDIYVEMSEYMTEENGYVFGTPSQTLNVQASGSSDDWMYGEQTTKSRIFAATPEVGSRNDGFWPASSRIIPLCNEVLPFNIKIMRMGAKYAKVTPQETAAITEELEGTIAFDIDRFSLKDVTWTVALSSTSQFVESTGTTKTYNSIDFLGNDTGAINFTLTENTPENSEIPVNLVINNGTWEYTKEVTIMYTGAPNNECTSPESFQSTMTTSNSAALEWAATSASNYTVRYRIIGAPNWITITVPTTNLTLDNLEPETNYEAQTNSICMTANSDFSPSIEFTTSTETLTNTTFSTVLDDITLFPNPVKNTLTIKTNSVEKNIPYEIFELTGKQVVTGKILKKEQSIQLASLATGTYVLLLKKAAQNRSFMFVKN